MEIKVISTSNYIPIKHYQSQKDYDIFTNIQVFKAVSEDVISKLLCQGHLLMFWNGYGKLVGIPCT